MSDPNHGADRPGPPDPSPLLRLTTAYWGSMTLLAANRLGVFGLLADRPASAEEIASRAGGNARAMGMLLNACVAQGLLEKSEGSYRNTDLASAFLVPGGPGYLGNGLEYALDAYPLWGRLTEAIRTGAPPAPPQTILGGDPEKTRHFVMAMHNRAVGVAASLASVLDLAGRTRLLDVGGGPGTYSILLTGSNPGLRSTVLDLPAVVAIAREIIEEHGAADRVETLEGDYHETPFPSGNDALLMSGMMHRETAEDCRDLLRRAFESLAPGGLLAVSDVYFDDEEKTEPPFAALFALNMMLTSEHGSAHAKPAMRRWMEECGFTGVEIRPLPPPMPHSVILGFRP